MRRYLLPVVIALGALLAAAFDARAGLGPENVLVVVNQASWASQAVANHYIHLRKVPITNVIYLNWTGSTDSTDVETFRKEILSPILIFIDQHGLADQIDAIAYSSDFPYSIDLTADLGTQKTPAQMSPTASITSATFLWQLVMSKNPNVIGLSNNQYLRDREKRKVTVPSLGFHSWYGWGAEGQALEGGGLRYLLSTMLAVTSGRGNSVPEAVGYLRRSAKADGAKYPGTIYFAITKDVRSSTRAGGFENAINGLREIGVAADVVNTTLPSGKKDVAGAMIGVSDFSWPSANSTILPGAICEHLTSFGGAMGESNGQTPLSELLRYGAAGASGTVVEPYAMQDKFPLPSIQLHYARGCALAEAFYQSLAGPYQLLIVGDPLCQPWARIPQVKVDGIPTDGKLTGTLELKATATVAGGKVDRLELFVDGRRAVRRPAGATLPLDTTKLSNGYHELRVVAIDSSPIETQGRVILPVMVENSPPTVELTANATEVRWGETLKLDVKTPGLDGGVIFFNGRTLGKTEGESGSFEVNPREFGTGPITLFALGIKQDRSQGISASTPLALTVSAKPLPALTTPNPTKLVRGMQLRLADGKTLPVQETTAPDWLKAEGIKPGEAYGLEGYFEVPPPATATVAASADDVAKQSVHQFQLRYRGQLKLAVDQVILHDGKDGDGRMLYLPIGLAPGVHRLRASGKAADEILLQIRYGGEGTRSIQGETFRHIAN